MKLRKFLKLILVLIIIFTSLISTVQVSAYSYVMTDNYWMPIPQPFTLVDAIMYIDGLDKQLEMPTDLFIRDGQIYIVDAKNNRIVKIDKKGNLLGVYDGEYGIYTLEEASKELEKWEEGLEKSDEEALYQKSIIDAKTIKRLSEPQGIYVDEEGDMYIADTKNQRIVHLAPDGSFVELFHQPQAETYDSKYPFRPQKVYIDAVKNIYIINEFDYHGLISIDADNEFLGYLAASKVPRDPLYDFYKLFVSEEELENITRITPPYFTNFVINEHDQLIYGVQMDAKENQIQIITPSGDNVYTEKFYGYRSFDSDSESVVLPMFVDIAVSPEGIIYAADNYNKEIYVYDQEGNNLAIFGGPGRVKETFVNIGSIALDEEGYLYVSDRETNIIQVFKPTDFMRKVNKASALYNQGRYDEAEPHWREVLEINSTYEMAIKGIAKSLFRQEKYKEAMQESLKIEDRLGYSEAFYEYRLNFFRKNFGWVVLAIILIIVALYVIIKYLYKLAHKADDVYDYSDDKYGIKLFFHTAILILLHPIDGFNKLKYQRDRYRWYHVFVLAFLILFVRVAYIYLVHFPLADTLPQYTDFLQEVLILFVPIGLWTIVSYGLITISDGKTKFKEAVISILYSFTPYIVLQLPLALLSRVMSSHESGLYNALVLIVLLWSIALVLLSTMQLNEYSFPKLVWTVVKVLFGIACTVMIAGIFYVLVVQFFTFIKEVNEEIIYMIR